MQISLLRAFAPPREIPLLSAESPRDFQHKLRVALKELRETFRWLKLAQRTPLIKPATKLDPLLAECDELIRIFVTSLRTSESRSRPQ